MGNGCDYSSIFLKSTFIIYLFDKGEVKNKTNESLPLEQDTDFKGVFQKSDIVKFWL